MPTRCTPERSALLCSARFVPFSCKGSQSTEAILQVVCDAQRIGDDRQGRIDRTAGGEKTRVHGVEVVQIVRSAVGIQYRALRILAETQGPVLMRHAGQRDSVADE